MVHLRDDVTHDHAHNRNHHSVCQDCGNLFGWDEYNSLFRGSKEDSRRLEWSAKCDCRRKGRRSSRPAVHRWMKRCSKADSMWWAKGEVEGLTEFRASRIEWNIYLEKLCVCVGSCQLVGLQNGSFDLISCLFLLFCAPPLLWAWPWSDPNFQSKQWAPKPKSSDALRLFCSRTSLSVPPKHYRTNKPISMQPAVTKWMDRLYHVSNIKDIVFIIIIPAVDISKKNIYKFIEIQIDRPIGEEIPISFHAHDNINPKKVIR